MQEEQFIINQEENGMRIDVFLSKRWIMFPDPIFKNSLRKKKFL